MTPAPTLPTAPIGSIPRPPALVQAICGTAFAKSVARIEAMVRASGELGR
jgi:hypothetical protein